MYHPLYHQATRCTGQPVFLYHVNGRVYHGTVVSVAQHGLYVIQHPPRTTLMTYSEAESGRETPEFQVSFADTDASVSAADTSIELVYSPVGFFAFGALTGLTLGAVAARLWW